MLAGDANVYQIYRKTIKMERETIKLILFNDKSIVGQANSSFACFGGMVYIC